MSPLKEKIFLFFCAFLMVGLFCFSVSGKVCLAEDLDQDFMAQMLEEYEEDTQAPQSISDPLYHFNHAMYVFNDTLYFYGLKPVATAYNAVLPQGLRQGISYFFHNLMFPVRFINHTLQGKIGQAGEELGIFLINSVFGVFGFFQVSQRTFALSTQKEDLGQTFGHWGIGNGFYLVLPIFGPSSCRDALGRVGDFFLTPVNYVEPWEPRLGVKALDSVNETGLHIGDYEALKSAAMDPYIAIRNAYVQNREAQIKK